MSSNVPRITGEEAVAAFEKVGFTVVRITGSHHIMKRTGHRHRLSIPVHRGKILGKGLLTSQIEIAGLNIDEFRALLKS